MNFTGGMYKSFSQGKIINPLFLKEGSGRLLIICISTRV